MPASSPRPARRAGVFFMKRDIMIDVLKGMGIATVVIGHIEGFWFTIMPVYSFHMPLFFFISGLFFSESTRRDFFFVMGGVIQNLVLPTLAVVLFYALVQTALNHFGIMPDNPTFAGVFRFGTKLLDTYWYIGCHFCVYLYFYLVHQRVSTFIQIKTRCRPATIAHFAVWLYFLAGAGCMYAASQIYSGVFVNDKWQALAKHENLVLFIRVGFGAFFYYLGSYFALLKNRREFSTMQSAITLLVCLAICRLCYYLTDGRPDFSMQIMYFPNAITPFVTSICGIGMLYAAANLLSGLRLPANVLAALGRRSFSIMSHHIFAFLLLNLVFLAMGLVDKAQLEDPYFKWEQAVTHPLYLLVGLAYPVLFSWLLSKAGGIFSRARTSRNTEGGAF